MDNFMEMAKHLRPGDFIVVAGWLMRVDGVETSNTTPNCIVRLTDVSAATPETVTLTIHEEAQLDVYRIR